MKNEKVYSILIINAHWNNRGDEAAIRAMIDSFKSNLSIKNIKIMFYADLYKDNQLSNENIEFLKSFPYHKSKISFFVIFLIDFLLSIITLGKLAFSKRGKAFISAINDSDIVIHAPGGPSIGDIYSSINEFFYLYKLFLSKLKGKKVYVYAPSMGPFSGKLRNFIRKFVLKRMDMIIVRDKISRKYLKNQLNLDSYLTLDSAFQNDILDEYLKKYSNIEEFLKLIKNQKVVGMTITDLSWHSKYKNHDLLKNNIIKSLENSIKFLIKEGYYVLLIPQLFGPDEKLEKPLIDYILKIDEKVKVLPPELDSYAHQIVISKLFCVIGMRYHPNIFSSKMNVPSIAIYYEHKTKSFMEALGRSDLVINVDKISDKKIIEKFIYLVENYELIKREISEKNPILKEKSKKTTELILNDLNKQEN